MTNGLLIVIIMFCFNTDPTILIRSTGIIHQRLPQGVKPAISTVAENSSLVVYLNMKTSINFSIILIIWKDTIYFSVSVFSRRVQRHNFNVCSGGGIAVVIWTMQKPNYLQGKYLFIRPRSEVLVWQQNSMINSILKSYNPPQFTIFT